MQSDSSEEKRWKYKYLDIIDILEQKERNWQLTEDSMRRGLSRLALVSTGVDEKLDIYLKQLRNRLNDGVSREDVDQIIDKISGYLKTLDQQGRPEEAATLSFSDMALNMLSQLVTKIEFPFFCLTSVQVLQKKMESGDANRHIDSLTDEFIALVRSAFYHKAGAEIVAENMQQADIRDKGKRQPQIERVDSGVQVESDPGVSAHRVKTDFSAALIDSRQLEQAFLDFLERLSLPGQFSERIQSLRSQLEAGLSAQDVAEMVKNMVALVSDHQRQLELDKEELEIFLEQLGQRLTELDAMLEGAGNHQQASLADNRRLDAMVNAQVSDIEDTVQRESDISQMKVVIRSRLENIREHFAESRRQGRLRQSELELQLKNMNQRLTLMEDESEHLRERLSEERILSMIDPLTNVPNRLGYEKQIAQEFARWQRYGSPLSLLVCDLDFFKNINDAYGHKAGDRALVEIAKSINRRIRKTDYMARIGGEEFVVILPETGMEEAIGIAEKIRKGVEACAFVYDGKPVPVTISGGVAEFGEGDEVDDVYIRADMALYRAKQKGRNCFMQ